MRADMPYEDSTEDIHSPNPIIKPTGELETLYETDARKRFNAFIQAADKLETTVPLVDQQTPLDDLEKADAQMLHIQSCYLLMGYKSVRSITDIKTMNDSVLKFIRERRSILGKPLNDNKGDKDPGYMEPV